MHILKIYKVAVWGSHSNAAKLNLGCMEAPAATGHFGSRRPKVPYLIWDQTKPDAKVERNVVNI